MPQDMNLKSFGSSAENRIISELPVAPVTRFDGLLDLKNLKGESTGYVKVFSGERIEKAASLSIDIAPGMRYFNIHIIPNAEYRIPRFLFEGMLSTHGSQVSMDLFPDIDPVLDVEYLINDFKSLTELYDKARNDKTLNLESSRQMHMRAFASPFFILAFGVQEDSLPRLGEFANGYFDVWLQMYTSGEKLSADAAELRHGLVLGTCRLARWERVGRRSPAVEEEGEDRDRIGDVRLPVAV